MLIESCMLQDPELGNIIQDAGHRRIGSFSRTPKSYRFRISYRQNFQKQIEVVRILHGRMDYIPATFNRALT